MTFNLNIEKARETGFCFGVRRAIEILEKAAREHGNVETLGAVVHNEQVMQRLAKLGITAANSVDEIQGKVVAISSHGVSPEIEAELKQRGITIVDTTCPLVRRAQTTARKLTESGFSVIVYGDAQHPEVKGILGWTDNKGLATLDAERIPASLLSSPRLGVLSQTTQIPEHFAQFTGKLAESSLTDAEIRIVDTICRDVKERQAVSLELAKKVDLMLVVGGRSSANTKRLAELCSVAAETHQIETAEEIDPSWLRDVRRVGVTSGTSTAAETVEAVLKKLKAVKV